MSGLIIVGADGSAAVGWAADDAARMRASLRIVTAVHRWPHDIPKVLVPEREDAMTRSAEKVPTKAIALARIRQPDVAVSWPRCASC